MNCARDSVTFGSIGTESRPTEGYTMQSFPSVCVMFQSLGVTSKDSTVRMFLSSRGWRRIMAAFWQAIYMGRTSGVELVSWEELSFYMGLPPRPMASISLATVFLDIALPSCTRDIDASIFVTVTQSVELSSWDWTKLSANSRTRAIMPASR